MAEGDPVMAQEEGAAALPATGMAAAPEAAPVAAPVVAPVVAPVAATVPVDPQLVTVLASGVKVKWRLPRMRACNEPKDPNKPDDGKICAGHLKRHVSKEAELISRYGAKAELYRCERCKTIYLPNAEETPRSGMLSY